jgi:hypothetical protein
MCCVSRGLDAEWPSGDRHDAKAGVAVIGGYSPLWPSGAVIVQAAIVRWGHVEESYASVAFEHAARRCYSYDRGGGALAPNVA